MPKRPAAEHRSGRSAKLPTRRRRHLYLVLDDWELGYTIRKVDLSSPDSDSDDDTVDRIEQRLPQAVFCLEAPHARSGQFAAFGTKIMFTGTHNTPWGTVPAYDVRTRALTSAPPHESEPNPYSGAYVQADGKLFFLDDTNFEMLHPLRRPPPPHDGARDGVRFDWSWRALPEPPFHRVVSHAVHPGERTVFFSIMKFSPTRTTRLATFSFDTETSQGTRRGAWGLPFKGRGYYDRDLDAWVGVSGDPDAQGHLCACDVASADADDADGQPPACKLSKEKLFCVDPAEKHIGATLVYMGGRSRFCLVQCLTIDDREGGVWKEFLPERRRYLLRVTTFSLRFDKNGDLRTAKQRQVGSYRQPEIARVYWDRLEKPAAFWM